jgi:hypothetical protein
MQRYFQTANSVASGTEALCGNRRRKLIEDMFRDDFRRADLACEDAEFIQILIVQRL